MPEDISLRDERGDLAVATAETAAGDLGGRIVVPVVEETLTIGKRLEETSIVRVHKRTTERTEDVRMETAHETVSVVRVPMNQIVDGPVEVRQEGDVTIVPVVEEVLVVEKRLMLREEVRITRQRTMVPYEETVVLRREEAEIERVSP